MADWGLLGGIGHGLQAGMQAYTDAKRYSDEQALKKRQQQIQMAGAGVEDNGEGGVKFTDAKQAQVDAEAEKSDREQDKWDRTSLYSQRMVPAMRARFNSLKPGLGDTIPEGLSAGEAEELLKSAGYEKEVVGIYGQRKQALIDSRMRDSMDLRRSSLDLRRDEQASRAADKIHNDKRVVQLTQQLDQLERGRSILDQPTITGQEFNDYQQEIQNAISGGSGGALGKLERTEYTTAQGELAQLKQKWTGKPQDAVPKEIVDRLKALADHTRDIMSRHRADRAQSLNRGYSSNPEAVKEMGNAIQTYAPGSGQQGLVGAKEGGGLVPNPAPTGSNENRPAPGTIVNVKGQRYRVGDDGDSLEPVQ